MKWKVENRSTINPYNFIPLGEECRRTKEKERNGKLTGVIECKIIPKTDLFIPNTSCDNVFHTYQEADAEKKRHLSYDFYSYSNLKGEQDGVKEPVIPASEIRGMIQSEYEALTNSCMDIDYDQILLRRTIQNRTSGILIYEQKDGWVLYEANRRPLSKEQAKKYKTGDIVEVISNGMFQLYEGEETGHKNKLDLRGIVLIGEGMGCNRKKTEHVFIIKENGAVYSHTIVENAIEKLRKIMENYRNENRDAYKNYNIPDEPKNGDMIPVWYYVRKEKEKELLYFSPAALGKDIYYNTLCHVIKNQTKKGKETYLPCDNQDNLCDACHLFGTISEKKKADFAVTGRLRFTDAHLIKKEDEELNQYFRSPRTLKILGGPKVNCTEFYTHVEKKDKQIAFWDYDWGNMDNIDISDDIKINGRKFYWHQKKENYQTNKKNNLNITARILVGTLSDKVKKVPEFQFKLYFEKISLLELERILWILSLGDNENELFHKIGMGKPLGLGSIKIQVRDVKLRKLSIKDNTIIYNNDSTEEYKAYYTGKVKRPEEDLFHLEQEQYIYNSYIKIMDFNGLESEEAKKISYPIGVERNGQENIFTWFTANKKIKGGTKFYKKLPKVLEVNVDLPVYKEINDKKNKKR